MRIFSLLSGYRPNQTGSHTSLGDEKESGEVTSRDGVVVVAPTSSVVGAHGVQLAVEFMPLEHPEDPSDNDQPVKCPMPEPSILNDGRIWKECFAEAMRKRAEVVSVVKEGEAEEEASMQVVVRKRHHSHIILPTVVITPEQNVLKLLQQCNEFEC